MRSLDDMAADFATEQKLRNANPDEDAKVIRLSERSGLARETVRRNLDSFADEFAAEYDLEGIDQDAPSMANLLRDPDGAALIADEVDYLRESEKDLGDDPSWLGGTLLSGLYQFAGGLAASAAPSATDALPGTMGLTGITLGDVSDQESIDIMRDAALGEAEALQGEAAELFPYEPGTDVWESIPVFSAYAIQGIARMAPGLLVGAATRNPGAASATIGADVYGATLLEGEQLGLTENETKARASFGSLIETVTGLAPWQRILKPLENVQLKSRLAKLAGAAGAEAGQEALVEGLQQAFDQGLLGLDQEKTFWDNLTDIGKAASLGAAIGGGLAAPSVILARGDQDAIDSERDQAKIDRLMDMADNVKLRERSEPLFDSYMESLADNYDIDAVFVDAGNVLFQDQPEIAQGRVVGTDVRIPLGEFMKLPKDAREALRADMRIRPDAMSANDLGTIEESLQADIEASAEIARQRVENSSAAREYRNALALQIAESGGPYNANESRAVATMMSDYLLTKAEREGLPFSEVAEVMPLTVEGEGFSGGDTLNQRQDPAEPRLQALHNLSSENLLFADSMGGGIAVPSIGVVPEGKSIEGFGDITLIGTRDLADPEQNPVFDADAYTATFPRPDYKAAKRKDAQGLVDEVRPWADKFLDRYAIDAAWDYSVNTPDPQRILDEWYRNSGVKAWFASEVLGTEADPIFEPVPNSLPWVEQPGFAEAFAEARDISGSMPGPDFLRSDAYREFSETAGRAIDAYAAAASNGDADIQKVLSEAHRLNLFNQSGLINFSAFDMEIGRAIASLGKQQVSTAATRDMLDASLAGHEAEFKSWVDQKVLGIFAEPRIKVGRKFEPYTLENIAQVMSGGRIQGREQNLTFGPGNARATAAKRFTDVEDMRSDADQIAGESEVNAAREQSEKLLEAWRNDAIDYTTHTNWRGERDTWEALDSSMRALAKAAKGRSLRSALKSEGFDNFPDRLVEDGKAAVNALMSAPVPYFEAKPQRVVDLSEFAAAVIPIDASPEVRAALERANVPAIEYGVRYDEEARSSAIQEATAQSDREGVLFQSPTTLNQSPERNGLGLYSAAEKAALDMNIPGWQDDKPVNGAQAFNKLVKTPGVKAEEIEWLGLEEFMKAGKVTQTEVVEFIRNNGVTVEEVVADQLAATDGIYWYLSTLDFEEAEGSEYISSRIYDELHPDYGAAFEPALESYLESNFADLVDTYNEDINEAAGRDLASDEITGETLRSVLSDEQWSEKLREDESTQDDVYHLLEADYNDEPVYRYTWQAESGTDYEITGSDDRGYSLAVDGLPRPEELDQVYSSHEAQIQARDFIERQGDVLDESDERAARWGEYVMDGPHDNYREVKLRLPNIEGDFYNDTHFPDRNIVAFMRVTDRQLEGAPGESQQAQYKLGERAVLLVGADGTVLDRHTNVVLTQENVDNANQFLADADKGQSLGVGYVSDGNGGIVARVGKETYFIDEMQSDWHQAGRQEGYEGQFSDEAYEAAKKRWSDLRDEMEVARSRIASGELRPPWLVIEEGSSHWLARRAPDHPDRNDGSAVHGYTADTLAELAEVLPQGYIDPDLSRRIQDADSDRRRMVGSVPNAPFKKDEWQRLALKRALVQAVEQGADGFGWVDAETMMDRWSDRYESLYTTQYDKKMPSMVKKLTGQKPRHKDGYWWVELTPELKEKIRGEGFSLFQPGAETNRGSIELFPSNAIIRLGEASDRSTFFHEAGHYFLELERRFAERDGATARQRDDWKRILDYLEVESGDQIETVHHEKWARSFEKYIAEGRAPSLEMRSVFRRFADWLTRVYQSLSALNVELTDDIRSVMDRMLATDEQIERASHWYGLEPTQASTEAGENGQDRAKESLRSQLMRELKSRAEKAWQEERSALVDEQMKELSESKLYIAIEAMKESKVDRAQVLDVLGLDNLAGQSRLRGLTQKDGLDIDDFAEMSGFGSGHWMMEEIQQSRPLRKAAEDAADALMLERHGDLLSDGRIEELADQAIHNEEQGRALLAELRSLRGGRGGADTLAIKHWAEEQVGQLRTSEIRPLTFQRQEVKAARAYERAIVEGDTELAAQFKLEQLQAFHLTRAAMRAKERVERYRKALKGYQSREYRDTEVRPDYAQNLRTYAKLYDFRKGGEPMAEAELGKLHAWLKSQIEDENEYIQPQIFDLVMTQLGTPGFQLPSWSEMTVDEFQGVYDQARHLRFMGGRLSESEASKRKLEAEALSDHIDEKGGKSKAERPFDGPLETIKRDTRRFFADHMRLLNRVRRIDGFEEDGLFKQKVYDPLSDASIREVELSREMGTRIEPLMRTVSTMDYMRGRGKRTIMTQAGREFTLPARERIMLGLYWGTPESRQALMDGYGLTETDVERMLAFLKPHELDFIEGIWEANESLWPEFSAMNTRMFGHSPAKVERLPFSVNGREMKGGYMRLFYRPAAKDAGNTALDKLLEGNPQGGGRHLGMTKSGAAIQRQGSGGRQVALDIANIGRGLEDVIHAIAFSEVSRVVGRLLQSEPVAQAIRDKHGEEVHKSLMDTVRSMIEPQNSANQTLVTRMLRYVRSNMSLGLLGYSIRNFVQQPIALTNGFAVLGEAAVVRGLTKFFTSPQKHYEWVNERSVFMQNRMKFVNREATELLNQLGQNTTFAKFKTHAFSLQTFGDAMVAYPIWLAGYEKGLEIHSGDEVKAAKHADDQVAGTIGSGMARDLSPMMSGSGVIGDRAGNSELAKQFTFMGSYFNVVYNLMADSVGQFDARSPKTYLEFGRSMFWLLLAPALISRLVISHFPGEDDEESVAQWTAEAVAEYGLASVFLLREVMTVYKGFDPKITGLDAFPGMKRVASEIGEATEEREVTENDAAQLLRGLMPLAPLPGSGQLARTLQYIESANEGGESNALPIYDALVEGKERNE